MTELGCNEVRLRLGEVALGVAGGRERAEVLVHVERCLSCRAELSELSGLADELVLMTPPAEPPAGFESKVLLSLREAAGADGPSPARPSPARPSPARPSPARPRSARAERRPRLAGIAAVAAALLALAGLGGWVVDRDVAGTGGSRTGTVRTASPASGTLTTGGRKVGQVIVSGGDGPWISVAVTDLDASKVICRVAQKGASPWTVGAFELTSGYGYWAAAIPPGSGISTGKPTDVELLDASGQVVASGTVTPS